MSLLASNQNLLCLGFGDTVIIQNSSHTSKLKFDGVSDCQICSMVINTEASLLYVPYSNKLLAIWDINMNTNIKDTLKLPISTTITVRRITAMKYTNINNNDAVIISDRLGEIWAVNAEDITKIVKLGGHPTSVITDLAISPCKNYIATSDRNEKIRITLFPQTLDIYGYGLAHSSVVRSIEFINNKNLISVGWDGYLCLWDYHTENNGIIKLLDQHLIEISGHNNNNKDEKIKKIKEELPSTTSNDDSEDDAGSMLPMRVLTLSNSSSNTNIICTLFKDQSFLYFCSVSDKKINKISIVNDDNKKIDSNNNNNGVLTLPTSPLDAIFIKDNLLIILLPAPYYIKSYTVNIELESTISIEEYNEYDKIINLCKQENLKGDYCDIINDGKVNGMSKKNIVPNKRFLDLDAQGLIKNDDTSKKSKKIKK